MTEQQFTHQNDFWESEIKETAGKCQQARRHLWKEKNGVSTIGHRPSFQAAPVESPCKWHLPLLTSFFLLPFYTFFERQWSTYSLPLHLVLTVWPLVKTRVDCVALVQSTCILSTTPILTLHLLEILSLFRVPTLINVCQGFHTIQCNFTIFTST